MNNKVLSCLIAGALAATVALASPALARGGGGGHGGMGGGMHGGGMGGGMHAAGMGGGMHFGGMGGGPHFSSMSGGPRFGGTRFASTNFAHPGFSPRSSGFAFHGRDGFRHHHRFHRFALFGAPYVYAGYDGCWRRLWTSYGLQWVNVCGDGYY